MAFKYGNMLGCNRKRDGSHAFHTYPRRAYETIRRTRVPQGLNYNKLLDEIAQD